MKNVFLALIFLTLTSCKDIKNEVDQWAKNNSLRKPIADTKPRTKISSVCPRGSTTDLKLSTETKKMCRTSSGTIFTATDAFQEFYPNGNPKTLLIYSSNNLTKVLWYENGRQKEEIQYRDNHKEGPYKAWFENGNLKEIANFSSGKKNGLSKIYHENGNVKEKSTYIADQKNGITQNFNELGKLISRETYKNDLKNGNAEYLNPETGNILSHGTFENNFRTGRWIYYNKDGTRSSHGIYNSKGEKHGEWKSYDQKGRPQQTEYYANNELTKKLELKANVVINNPDQLGARPPQYRPQNRYKVQPTPIQEKTGWQPL